MVRQIVGDPTAWLLNPLGTVISSLILRKLATTPRQNGLALALRACHLPQRIDAVCGAACQGEGPSGTGDGGRTPGVNCIGTKDESTVVSRPIL